MTKSRDIDEQKKFYKNGSNSLCLKCSNYNEDCFDAEKQTGTSKNSNYSTITKCGDLNKSLKKEYKATTVTTQVAVDSRIDSMGGGFQNIDKYKNEVSNDC